MWVCGAFVYIGAHTSTALNIGLIYAASPILVVLRGRLLEGAADAPDKSRHHALLVGVATVFTRGRVENLFEVQFGAGDLWIAAGSASWGLYSVLLRHRSSRFRSADAALPVLAGGLADPAALHHRRGDLWGPPISATCGSGWPGR